MGKRCKQCDHLDSFHGSEGCTMWLLGVRAVPIYRCACVMTGVQVMKNPSVIPKESLERLEQAKEELLKSAEELKSLEETIEKMLEQWKEKNGES
jgi:hypothetical protein